MALAAAPAALADVPTAEAQDVRDYPVGPPYFVTSTRAPDPAGGGR